MTQRMCLAALAVLISVSLIGCRPPVHTADNEDKTPPTPGKTKPQPTPAKTTKAKTSPAKTQSAKTPSSSAPEKPGPDKSPQPAESKDDPRPVDPPGPVANDDSSGDSPDGGGDYLQWGRTSHRNNVVRAKNIPIEWNVGKFDDQTGEWNPAGAKNVKWVARLGSQTYGNPIIADGRVFVGTNNGAGWLPRYPEDIDLGCMLAFTEQDGEFLWQFSAEKLPTGRVHDWLLQGVCSTPIVEGDRMWFVSNRGHVVCLDTKGYYDGEDDGPVTGELARLFKFSPSLANMLDDERIDDALRFAFLAAGRRLPNQVDVESEPGTGGWLIKYDDSKGATVSYRVALDDGGKEDGGKTVTAYQQSAEKTWEKLFSFPAKIHAGLSEGKLTDALRAAFAEHGEPITGDVEVTTEAEGKKWKLSATIAGKKRQISVRMEGPALTAFKHVTVDDQHEADTVWFVDMMKDLGVSQHNMASCSFTTAGDLLFVCTSNGVDAQHNYIPAPDAPSFLCMDKNSGKIYWTDKSPGLNILHGQWSSPAYGVLGGVPQVIFAGGDGWLYSFKATANDSKAELLWKFDCNPKTSVWEVLGTGTRNNIIATPVIYKDRVYVAVGQDPEHGDGEGHLWCIDPTKRGDVSPQLAFTREEAQKPAGERKPMEHQRIQAVIPEKGQVALDNPNSAVVWHYAGHDYDGDGELAFEEKMHRSCGTVAIVDDILFIADFSGLFHCLDAKTGRGYWTHDMLGGSWGSPLITDGHVYMGDEDGDLAIFNISTDPNKAMKMIDDELQPINAYKDEDDVVLTPNLGSSIYSTPVVANGVLYVSNRSYLIAFEEGATAVKPNQKPAESEPRGEGDQPDADARAAGQDDE